MKKYIAPACEMVNLATTSHLLLGSLPVDPDKKVVDPLSNRAEDFDGDWED